ncbi:MAG: aldo/keto reductase [Candidatus Latescibacteria bacterium]|nr:aldo/keto reductase [Candidatus Latescibacterota bacterium]
MSFSSRRNFLRSGAALGAGIAATGFTPRRIFAQNSSFKRIAFRQLGSTGEKVSEIGFGAMNTRDDELLEAAIDMGINYVDTAWVYMKGVNEEMVGRVIKGKRDKLFLTTKAISKNPDELMGQMEMSLKRLQTDHVDLMLFHVTNSREQILNNDVMKVFENARKKGMCRFVGVSTHENQAEVLDAAVESKFWEAVLVGYNYFSPPEVGKAIENARNAGLGIIGMKNLLNPASWPWKELDDIRTDKQKEDGKVTAAQALIKWVLEDRHVDTTIPGITSFEQLRDDVAVMGMPMSFGKRRSLIRYGEALRGNYCCGVAGCTGCQEQCPKGVCVNNLNRCLSYANSYGSIELARENYAQLPRTSKIDICDDCDECVVRCINGLDLNETIRRARELFA